MADFGRVQPIIWDVSTKSVLLPTGAVASVNPAASVIEHIIIQVQLVNGSVSVVKPISGYSTGTANLDNLFNDSANLAAQALTAAFNVAGDWPSGNNQTGGNADPTQGQLSIRLNCNTSNALTKLAQSSKLSPCRLEILLFDSTSNNIFSDRIPFDLNGVQDPSSGGLPVGVSNPNLTAAQAVALYVPFVCLPGATIILPQADGTKAVAINCVNGTANFTTISPYTP